MMGRWRDCRRSLIPDNRASHYQSLRDRSCCQSLRDNTARGSGSRDFQGYGSAPAGPGQAKHSTGTARMPGPHISAGSPPVGQCSWTHEQGRHQVSEDHPLFAWLLIMSPKCQQWIFVYQLKTKKTHVPQQAELMSNAGINDICQMVPVGTDSEFARFK